MRTVRAECCATDEVDLTTNAREEARADAVRDHLWRFEQNCMHFQGQGHYTMATCVAV